MDDVDDVSLSYSGLLGRHIVSLLDYPFSVARRLLVTPENAVHVFFGNRQNVSSMPNLAQL
jgi:hypothetical protein